MKLEMQKDYKDNKILTSDIYKQYIKELKPNPNQWIIIKKWNYRIFKKHENELYVLIDNYITELIQKEIEEFFKKFAEVNEINLGTRPGLNGTGLDFNKNL